MLEDRLLERAQRRGRGEPELGGQAAAVVVVGGERLGLAVAAIQREHLLAAQALAQGLLGDELGELVNQDGVAAEREVGVDAVLGRAQPAVVEPRRGRRDRFLVREVRQGGAAPERERVAQQRGGRRCVAVGQRCPPARREDLELGGVDRAREQRVAVPAGDELVLAERLAQRGHEVVQAARGAGRGVFAPQEVHQPLSVEHFAGVQRQHGEQQPLAALAECHDAGAVVDLQRAEDQVAHAALARPYQCSPATVSAM